MTYDLMASELCFKTLPMSRKLYTCRLAIGRVAEKLLMLDHDL